MQGDFSRFRAQPDAPWTRVLFQQGRVQLDADLNEQAALLLRLYRTLARDVLGPHAAAPGDQGFALRAEGTQVLIGAGRYWVEGWPVENADGKAAFAAQAGLDPAELQSAGGADARGLFYLEAWERAVTTVEWPELLEPALGGVETTLRARLAWRVRWLAADPDAGEEPTPEEALSRLRTDGRMRARLGEPQKTEGADDLCRIDADARYAGPENQLYRVEIHKGGPAGAASFKWSRENGSVLFPLAKPGRLGAGPVALARLGRDERTGLREGHWVELLDLPAAEGVRPGRLARVRATSPDEAQVELADFEPGAPHGEGDVLFLRRWDHAGTAEAPALPLAGGADEWTPLEHGLEVAFDGGAATYRACDHWLVPARVASPRPLWPLEAGGTARALLPHGPERVVAPLGRLAGQGQLTPLRRQVPWAVANRRGGPR